MQIRRLSADYTDYMDWKKRGEEFSTTEQKGFTQIIEKEDVLIF